MTREPATSLETFEIGRIYIAKSGIRMIRSVCGTCDGTKVYRGYLDCPSCSATGLGRSWDNDTLCSSCGGKGHHGDADLECPDCSCGLADWSFDHPSIARLFQFNLLGLYIRYEPGWCHYCGEEIGKTEMHCAGCDADCETCYENGVDMKNGRCHELQY